MKLKLTLEQAIDLIKNTRNTYFLEGSPGIGKTHTGKVVADDLDWSYYHVDLTQTNPEDIGIPYVDTERKVSMLFPNELFGLHEDKPCVIMLDEFSKADEAVQKAVHSLLDARKKYIGGKLLHKDTKIICTGNMTSDGLGDNIQAHTMDRWTVIHIKKPNAKQFALWCLGQGRDKDNPKRDTVHPLVSAWVMREPSSMDDYPDLSEEELKTNAFIYNPDLHNGTGVKFGTPRGYVNTTDIIYAYQDGVIDENIMTAGLVGTIGEAGGHALSNLVVKDIDMPTWEEIFSDPTNTEIPEDPAILLMLVSTAIRHIEDEDQMSAWFKFMKRIPHNEYIALFITSVRGSNDEEKNDWMLSRPEYRDMKLENKHLVRDH